MDNLNLWLLFIGAGLGTFLIRLCFIQLHGFSRTDALLQRCKGVMMLLPPAILAALCIPPVLFSRPLGDFQLELPQLLAAVVTVLIARFSNSVFWPVVGGMICFWLLRSVFGG